MLKSLRRSPIYAVPVIFRDKKYAFRVAAVIDRFDPYNSLFLITDSHYFRIKWLRRLMPDIRVIWLDVNEKVRYERLQDRLVEDAKVTHDYIDRCLQTKEIADLVIETDTMTPVEIAATILTWLA